MGIILPSEYFLELQILPMRFWDVATFLRLAAKFEAKCLLGNSEVSKIGEVCFSRYCESARNFDPSPYQTIKVRQLLLSSVVLKLAELYNGVKRSEI
ncbi:hypothetical protein AVEN_254486-1 [Araneus ventricosus]|uniref:Uncharacterized protein n=1 Tax=Araneus ventricosus TaxID=182803 RepID=A0A4Y2UCD6_ARAVE|nr:hypothetical protein AVEN_254486-1 [Araneus ventricosus]